MTSAGTRRTPRPAAPAVPQDPAARRRWLALAVLAVAQFMVFLDETVVNVALPSIKTSLGFSQTSLAWVISAYVLAFGGLILLGGRAADLAGRRRIFLIGTAIFGIASLLDGLATSQGLLIGARALQGVGAALATPAALALVTNLFPAGAMRTKALTMWGGAVRARLRRRGAARRGDHPGGVLAVGVLHQRPHRPGGPAGGPAAGDREPQPRSAGVRRRR